VATQLLDLATDVFFEILKRIEEGGSDRGSAGAILDLGAQILFAGLHQPAIRVIDDHELLGAQQIVRHEQRAQAVVRNDAAGIANDVSIARLEAQRANRKAGIHAGEHGELSLGARRQIAQFVRARVDLVRCEDFVDDAHGP